jgi:hypothetical protein
VLECSEQQLVLSVTTNNSPAMALLFQECLVCLDNGSIRCQVQDHVARSIGQLCINRVQPNNLQLTLQTLLLAVLLYL